MKPSKLLFYALLTVTFFILGFLTSLGIHWQLHPTIDSTATPTETVTATLPENILVLQQQNKTLKTEVTLLENKLAKTEVAHDIDEGHARALINELQIYRNERDRLFADLEARKQKMIDKLAELDEKIIAQVARREEQPKVSDYEQANELLGLLSYPHALNDSATLNSALLEHPAADAELVQQRFEIMLQPEAYDRTDKVYEALLPVVKKLNEEHSNDTQLLAIFCTKEHCEIQVQMQKIEPYFDYWQQWQKALQGIELTKLIQLQFVTQSDQTLLGTVIVKMLPQS